MKNHASMTAVVIGAGPAGLTAALELLERTDIRPIVLEKSHAMGGISQTVNHRGNRIDIGGHRFFSKSERVMQWWLRMLPLQATGDESRLIHYHNQSRKVHGSAGAPDPDSTDRVMLLRSRRSRIYYRGKLFDYPISPTIDTLSKLGWWSTVRIGASYLRSTMFPIRPEENLEQFFINRFGRELYLTFFKEYTEKVWGTPCHEISAEWGAQRIKGLSLRKALSHFLARLAPRTRDLAQKEVETSLIERFLYPKYGPGQMWEEVADRIRERAGTIETGMNVRRILVEDGDVAGVVAVDDAGREHVHRGKFVFSTMPIRELVRALDHPVPAAVRDVAEGLQYRDFITVGILLDELLIHDGDDSRTVSDNWIYIQEPGVLVGRMQIFNNWSPYMVSTPGKIWVGLEYFCNETDAIWSRSDEEMVDLAIDELVQMRLAHRDHVRDTVVIRMPKTYPAYFGTYHRIGEVRAFTDGFPGLFLLGRNGMHRYNNQDHSMLTAMVAIDNIVTGRADKNNIWEVNTEQDYHEGK